MLFGKKSEGAFAHPDKDADPDQAFDEEKEKAYYSDTL